MAPPFLISVKPLDSRQILINELADGTYHSGEALGEQLNVSRSAVWKQLRKLENWGIELESCKRRGYRIPGGLSLLDASKIKKQLVARAAIELHCLEVHQTVDSTNELAMRNALHGSVSGSVFLAEAQSAGKGRRGRVWISPYGRNIYLSAVYGFSGGVTAVEGLSLAVGVAVVRSLEAMGIRDLGLKWPNDIFWSARKLGGVLLEISGDPAGACDVIVGIGINVQMSAREAAMVDQKCVNLSEITGRVLDRSEVAAHILNGLLPLLGSYADCGFSHYRDAWQTLDCFDGESVVLVAGETRIGGVARGVNEAGALRIETMEGTQFFSGGEISLRKRQ
jgi:BirA family biotin operon repressor/biotin-[acetyl-CoA-carboxylase] ligase